MNDDLNEAPMTDEEIAAEKESFEMARLKERKKEWREQLEKFKIRKCWSREDGRTHYLKREEHEQSIIRCVFCKLLLTDKSGNVLREV